MNPRLIVALLGLCLALTSANAVDPHARSDSVSKQFSVYCEDVRLRHRVVGFVEDVKGDVLRVLGEPDRWKVPIIVTIEPESSEAAGAPPVALRLLATDAGPKIEINVRIGSDPAAVNLQKQVVRAVLLEFAYRDRPISGGMAFVESPWWIIEGTIQIARRQDLGMESDLFRTLVDTNKLPPIEGFLAERPDGLGATAMALDQALSLCLIQLLIEQENGKSCLSRFVRDWPRSGGGAAALLKKEFPGLAAGEQDMQKWWTLNLARFAAADRYQGLTAEDTEKELVSLLQIEAPADKRLEKQTFALDDFAHYLKRTGTREILKQRHASIIALGSCANALYRPVIADYEAALALLAKGKTRGVREKFADGERRRALVIRRTAEISDYLNWFEATQMGSRSDTFDNYLKAANELSEQERSRTNPVARYLDELEREF